MEEEKESNERDESHKLLLLITIITAASTTNTTDTQNKRQWNQNHKPQGREEKWRRKDEREVVSDWDWAEFA